MKFFELLRIRLRLFRFDCAAGLLPRIEATGERISLLEAMIAEHLRHTGA